MIMFVSRELCLFCTASVFMSVLIPAAAWDSDLELFDLVEEIPQTFYEFLSVGQDASSAEIKKAYRRLSLILHPDKNKDENAEIQFRQLVAIYEVLKDEERRQRYNDILINGLPDWRQPVFYYRRVRKMSNMELAFLLFLILTVGHYAIIWSIYLEKQLDELLTKKKKEKKKKINSKSTEEVKCAVQERSDRAQDKPHWQDILPLKLSIWIYLSIKALPHTIQDVNQYYEDYKLKKMKEREEAEAMAEQEAAYREKKPKVKKPKLEFPVFEPSMADGIYQTYESASIEEIEEQMDDWLENKKLNKKKVVAWTDDDLSLLSRSMVKFPGGTPGRWEKIAHDLGRSVADVTAKVKQVKDNVSNTAGLVKLSDLKGSPVPWKAGPADALITHRELLEEGAAELIRRRSKKTSEDGGEVRIKGRRQRDFDPMAVEKEVEEKQKIPVQQDLREKSGPADSVWTQNQQKLLELALQQYPRGTTERWDRIAKVVPGKNKEECMIRYKLLAELVQKRKQTKI